MGEFTPSDYVDSKGTVYKTVGDNIRHAETSVDSSGLMTALDDVSKKHAQLLANTLSISAEELKEAVYVLFRGLDTGTETIEFGGTTASVFNFAELENIKNSLG